MKSTFSIGKISKIFDVSMDTLRYYDKIGILKPEVNNENNYRVYGLKHTYILSLILGARYLEIPIKDIKKALDNDKIDFDNYVEFMETQERILENKIAHLKKIKGAVEESKNAINRAKEYKNNYDFNSIEKVYGEKEFFPIPIKELINKNICKRFSKAIEIDNRVIEYFTSLEIKEEGKIYPNNHFLFIEKSPKNIKTIKKINKNNNFNIKEISIKGTFISVEFLGTEEEILKYIKDIISYEKFKCKNIFIKTVSFFLSKNVDLCFIELIVNI